MVINNITAYCANAASLSGTCELVGGLGVGVSRFITQVENPLYFLLLVIGIIVAIIATVGVCALLAKKCKT